MKKNRFRSFEKARKFTRSLNFSYDKQWRDFAKSSDKPDDIPADPRYFYKDEFKGMGDWLGTGRVAYKNQQWRTYHDARKFVQTLKLKHRDEWNAYCKSGKKPDDIPVSPYNIYKDEFKGMGDWLGTGRVANQRRRYRSFEKARKFTHSLKLDVRKQWVIYCKSSDKPDDIPTDPAQVYKKEWIGWGDWLGTGRVASQKRKYLPIIEAKILARKLTKDLRIKNNKDWVAAYDAGKIPKSLPSSLWHIYGKEKNK